MGNIIVVMERLSLHCLLMLSLFNPLLFVYFFLLLFILYPSNFTDVIHFFPPLVFLCPHLLVS